MAPAWAAAAAAAAALAAHPGPAAADWDTLKLPPIDPDPQHCERAFVGNTIGQANAVQDRPLDLRECALPSADLKAKTLSGALMSKSDFSGSNMQEAVLSKVYAVDSDFSGVDFTSAVIDRAALMGSKFVGANFYNAVFTGVGVEGSDFTDARFEDALIGSQDAKFLCENPTVKGDARLDIGCRN